MVELVAAVFVATALSATVGFWIGWRQGQRSLAEQFVAQARRITDVWMLPERGEPLHEFHTRKEWEEYRIAGAEVYRWLGRTRAPRKGDVDG